MHLQNNRRHGGNALIMVLIAVALFAALSYAVTKANRGGKNITKEEEMLMMAKMTDHFSAIQQAVQRMILSGISETQISFDHPKNPQDYVNPNCTAPDCLVFGAQGGNVPFNNDALSFLEGNVTGAQVYDYLGKNAVQGVGTTAPDLIVAVDKIKVAFCAEYNSRMRISGIPVDTDIAVSPTDTFKGTFPATATKKLGDEASSAALAGKLSGCFFETNGNKNIIYSVLIAR